MRVLCFDQVGFCFIVKVVHVDDIFAVGSKGRCDHLCDYLSRLIPVSILGELR